MLGFNGTMRIFTAGAFAVTAVFGATAAMAGPDQGSIARGGRLYDKWYKVVKAEKPTVSHKLYPSTAKKADDPASNWRCKECHGWDGLGAAGAYATGSHATGIKGINGMIGADPEAIIAVLTSEDHGYGDKLSADNLADLANFVAYGQVDLTPYIDVATKASKGDPVAGGQVFNTVCYACHGYDGMLPKNMPPMGALVGNPQEVFHKLMNGQPGEEMPALRAIDHQVAADVLAYMATLPAE
jgi:thiosulfate dehydrogenase